MTVTLTASCDGHRSGQPCRGARHTRWAAVDLARTELRAAGWTYEPQVGDVCPSAGHDELLDLKPAEGTR